MRVSVRRLCVAPALALALTAAGPAAAETVDADLDGDGITEAVSVSIDDSAGSIDVTLSGSGATLRRSLDASFVFEPFVEGRRNVDGRPGDELLVHVYHISTYESYAFVTLVNGQLRVTSRLMHSFGLGDGYAMGFRCGQVSGQPGVVTYDFGQLGSRRWQRFSRSYIWVDGRLKRRGPTRRSVVRRPAVSERRIRC